MALLTPADIKNPKRKSGYNHVHTIGAGANTQHSSVRYQASSGTKPKRAGHKTNLWRGPGRPVAGQAAQDYCDHINGLGVATPATPLTQHGHTRKRRRKVVRTQRELDAMKVLREEAAKRKTDDANYIYLIGMKDNPSFVKIGEAFDPEDRYLGGQTFNPYTLVLLGFFEDTGKVGDKHYHRLHAGAQHKGEWFYPADTILARFNITRSEFLRRCGGTTKEVKAA